MKNQIFGFTILVLTLFTLPGCSGKLVPLSRENLDPVNREITAIDREANSVALNNKVGDGMAVIEGVNFDVGTIEVEIKGEDIAQKSFVGIAFNIQNDSTYEAVYFRPFNFRAEEKTRRQHSMQYIFHPKHSWRFLRTNFEGKYEAEFPRKPAPNDWFKVTVKIDDKKVHVFDGDSKTELLVVERLTEQVSDKIGLWTGNDSKGEFRNLKIRR